MTKNRKYLYIAIAAVAAVAVFTFILYFALFSKKGEVENNDYPIKEQFSFVLIFI